MKKNPLPEVLELFDSSPKVVTINLLDKIKTIVQNTGGVTLNKYSEAFDIIELLAKNDFLNLETDDSGSHKVTRKLHVKK